MTTDAAGESAAEPEVTVAEPVAMDDAGALPPQRHRARSIIASVLGVLAVLVLLVTTIAVWAKATVLRSEPVADMATEAIAQPEVQQGLATYLSTAAADAVDIETALRDVLPDALDRFAPSIAAGAEAAVQRVLERVIATDQFQRIMRTAVERAHARAMRLLQGDGIADGVNVADGQVTLNLLPLLTSALTELQSATGLFANVQIPELSADGDPTQQIAELESALGRDLPDDFGQLAVYRSDSVARAEESVKTAQRMLVLAKRAVWALLLLAVVLIAATILVAARRLRAVLALALGTTAAFVVLRSATRAAVDQAPDLARRPGGKAAIRAILDVASESLLRLSGVVLLIAIVTVIVMLFVRHWRRGDIVLVAAVMLGALTTAAVGVGSWGLLAGLVVGIAVPFVARWLWPGRPAPPPPEAPTPAEAAVAPAGAT